MLSNNVIVLCIKCNDGVCTISDFGKKLQIFYIAKFGC